MSIWVAEHLLCPRLGAPEKRWWRSSASSPQDLAPALERAHHKRRTNGPELDCSSTSSGRVAGVSPEADVASRKKGRFSLKDLGKQAKYLSENFPTYVTIPPPQQALDTGRKSTCRKGNDPPTCMVERIWVEQEQYIYRERLALRIFNYVPDPVKIFPRYS